MSKAYRTEKQTTTVSGAISDAYGELQSLYGELDEIVSNAEGTGLENTQRIQTLMETRDSALADAENEPEIPDSLADLPVEYSAQIRRRGSASRAVRHDNAISALYAAKEAVESFKGIEEEKEEKDEGLIDAAQELIDHIDTALGDFEGAEYPGMFG